METQRRLKQSREKELFEVFYNSLSVGWHLRRLAEIDDVFMANNYDQFKSWLERHKIKWTQK